MIKDNEFKEQDARWAESNARKEIKEIIKRRTNEMMRKRAKSRSKQAVNQNGKK